MSSLFVFFLLGNYLVWSMLLLLIVIPSLFQGMQVNALMNIETKKKYEFLESISAIMDAHLRYFKQVCFFSFCGVLFVFPICLVLTITCRPSFFCAVHASGLRVIESIGAIYSPGTVTIETLSKSDCISPILPSYV